MILDSDVDPLKGRSKWQIRYSEKHKPKRIRCFPGGIESPQKVRIYSRGSGFLLQFWDPSQKRTLNERVEGDLIAAIVQARGIDQRLLNFKRSGKVASHTHQGLVFKYLEDLEKRCSAGEIDVTSVQRYTSAVKRHYLGFCEGDISRKFATIEKVDPDFCLGFVAYLRNKLVSPNGHTNAKAVPMKENGRIFVNNVVRAMFEWAADPLRGNLLPDGFVNPFLGRKRSSTSVVQDRIHQLNITTGMAVDLIRVCDSFQLPIFTTLILCGLRPSELGWLFWDDVGPDWIRVLCKPELDYYTKGRHDKTFPVIQSVLPVLFGSQTQAAQRKGLVFQNRKCHRTLSEQNGFKDVVELYRAEWGKHRLLSAKEKRRLRTGLMRAEGQLSYNYVKREFEVLARQLQWPDWATLKDFRHLFSTSLENAGVPEYFRKYLMGQSFGRSPIVAYTHITEDHLRRHYLQAIDTEMSGIVGAITQRQRELGRRDS